ncbi:MAG TPA: endolytic transglycosylase MltG [Treponemataceae bacterium]|nr:endolytic transglycosylase MltG [Treponemataceae bacterium]
MRRKTFLMKIRNVVTICISCIVLFFLMIVLFYIFLLRPVATHKNRSNEITYKITIPSGATTRRVAKELVDNNIIRNDTVLYLYARFNDFILKAGTYTLHNSMSISEIIQVLNSGVQEYIKINIPEGLTISKIGRLLEINKITTLKEFRSAATNKKLLKLYGIPAENFEGFLFPDTYFLTENMNSNTIVKLMVDTFFEKTKSLLNLSENTIEDIFATIILASIIEKEYRVKKEAPLIASVFTNRLNYNIGLYSCATVEYIITEIYAKPHPEVITTVGPNAHTKIDNPYNTYKWAGLPPGPISNPGLITIKAAVEPAKTNYYFFRLIDAEKGIHVFTHDFDEHKEIINDVNTNPIGGK